MDSPTAADCRSKSMGRPSARLRAAVRPARWMKPFFRWRSTRCSSRRARIGHRCSVTYRETAPARSREKMRRRARVSEAVMGRAGLTLLQVEDFLQHGEALAVLLVGDGFEETAHERLPALVDGVFVEFVPGLVEIVGAQNQGQILAAAKDGVIADSDFLQLG